MAGKRPRKLYRWTNEGEQRIWASNERLRRMAREDALRDVKNNFPPAYVGNPVFDEEYRRERQRLEDEKR